MKNLVLALILAGFAGALSVSAHVVVKPNQVGTAAFQTFTMGVPNEKEVAVTGLRLIIPSGLKEVSPTVKTGWTVETKKDGDTITEISWTGGNIPAEQRDDFTFSAQVPATATTIQWKAYQTYADGSVVSWDQDPATVKDDEGAAGPYSTTAIVDDLTDTGSSASSTKDAAFGVSIAALVLSLIAIALPLYRRS